MDINLLYFIVPICAIIGLLFAVYCFSVVKREKVTDAKMVKISDAIHLGAKVFLKSQYKAIAIFVIVVAVILLVLALVTGGKLPYASPVCYIIGAALSMCAGYIGMHSATKANVRTTNAAKRGIADAVKVSFASGSVMGMSVVGLGLLGLSIVFIILVFIGGGFGGEVMTAVSSMVAFGFGASSVALFARVGGGIFTKAADVGADLVGKVEVGIPEDDPRNPAVIADNVGDNVGDVAGMGADLFESYVGSIIASMALCAVGAVFAATNLELVSELSLILLPLFIAAFGIIAAIVGTLFVRTKKNESAAIHKAFNTGTIIALVVSVIGIYFATSFLLYDNIAMITDPLCFGMGIWYSCIVGLLGGFGIGLITEYYTSFDYKPTLKIAESCQTGAATDIITGFAKGMESTIWPVLIIAVAVFIAAWFAGVYGIGIAAVGMLSTLGISLAVDAYGPVADNAGGIAEMSGQDPKVREITDTLDAVGNTTAAIGKGFAIGSAALTGLALFSAYANAVGLDVISILDTPVFIGIIIGGMLPFLFSALTMTAVGQAAEKIVIEVRRQFKEIPGLMEGKADPDYGKAVGISTKSAIKKMIAPGLLAIIAPIVVVLIPGLGAPALGGLLVGSLVSGFLLAITMANAGGAWDNAKKYVEMGHYGGKGSDSHKAAVVGDTVGDPFKDTSGPSINILIKLMSMIALVFVPVIMLL
ncbi:MAG TPA: sodium-translocating pyrophosphatase [Methanocorpusculum sp.]|nr:sodium-translocating pyrophosphatase [Candidatus Methanocorpusculum equi]MCQ2358109.1 sodium-translocating pyrophosphatase [Methanocorpusculum sp.]HJJ33795.1 sodium-translocating pyrophosphatase [Methanocorpusculum sp.]HJJ44708.1 sodium-translocating pyrophosphatase [Methanocorpusculum sp.]